MFEKLRSRVLHWLRIPPEPEAPASDPAKVKVFRASRRLYCLRLLGWAIGQMMAFGGVLFWFGILFAAGQNATVKAQVSQNSATGVLVLLLAAKVLGVVVYFIQMAVTYVAVRLDYELRWYIVTDRSLRIRSGLWTVQEITMSFANIQQVVVSQGPLARMMGIADVRVESAGGGASQQLEHGKGPGLHTGVFHGVENAREIRDLILDRLRQFRETGLGDPDEVKEQPALSSNPPTEVILAARELLMEMRALRETLR